LFGPGGKDIVESGDADEDKTSRAHFAQLAHERKEIHKDPTNPDRTTVSIGTEDWPLPVPLVRQNGAWRFDPAAKRPSSTWRRSNGSKQRKTTSSCTSASRQSESGPQPAAGPSSGALDSPNERAARSRKRKRVLDAARARSDDQAGLDGLAGRVLLSMLEQRCTRQSDRAISA